MAYDEKLADRIRGLLAGLRVEEKPMMGGLCFMVNGNMCCAASRDGLMVRVGPVAYEETLTKPHVRPLQMKSGKRFTGYVKVDPAGFKAPAALERWVAQAVSVVTALPPKSGAKKKKAR